MKTILLPVVLFLTMGASYAQVSGDLIQNDTTDPAVPAEPESAPEPAEAPGYGDAPETEEAPIFQDTDDDGLVNQYDTDDNGDGTLDNPAIGY